MVLAVPAPEAMRLVELPDPPAAALRRVGYDGRCAVAMVLDHAIYSAVADAFGSQAELNVDGHKWHLLAWQNVKAGPVAHGDALLLVAHSACDSVGVGEALDMLAAVLGLPKRLLEALLLESKVVDWSQTCQMVRPLEAITSFQLKEPIFQHGRTIVAGDFWSQSSFLGCYCSAKAAARRACEWMEERNAWNHWLFYQKAS